MAALTLTEASAALDSGVTSSSKLVADALAVGAAGRNLGAFLDLDADGARAEAAASDARRAARATRGPLDGVPVAVKDNLCRAGRPVTELLADFRRYPQLIQNVRVRAKPDLSSLPEVAAAAREAERRLGDEGRLVLRYSGTEPLARVMIEGPDEATVRELAGRVAEAIRAAIGD